MATTFRIKGCLSEIDKRHLEEKPSAHEEPKNGNGRFVHRGEVIVYRLIDTRNGREWKCPFCTCNNSTTVKKCHSCGAHDGRFGNLDFAYKTPTKKLLDSGGFQMLKEAVRAEFGDKRR
jgi:rubrerythrin